MRFKGRLTNWNDDKGFGFVEPISGGERSFVHIKAFQSYSRRPVDGDLIIYEQVKESQGKFKAVNVTISLDRKPKAAKPNANNKPSSLGSLFTISFCIVLLVMAFSKAIPIEALFFYGSVSFITFLAYAFDKSSAQNGRWRTPEANLHILSLIGGWPGAFYAQNKLRHKSSKKSFQQTFWVTVIANVCGFIWLVSQLASY